MFVVTKQQGMRVLLVGDDQEVVDAVARGLRMKGYKVGTYSDPSAALMEFAPHTYDIAVLDVRMRPIGGLELYQRLRALDSKLAVCFLTACADVIRDKPDGTDFLQKPISLSDLASALEDVGTRRRKGYSLTSITLKSRSTSRRRSQMDDLTTYVLLTTSFFFVALALALLLRYRQVSQRINASTDLGHDLWSSLEGRLKKQDERILDVVGRLEIIQARVVAAAAAQVPTTLSPLPVVAPPAPSREKPSAVTGPIPIVQQPESQESQVVEESPVARPELDDTQVAAMKLLNDGPKNTRQLTDALRKSREHTARLMKELFGAGLVKRNDGSKPFVYELTEEGRRRLD